MKTSLIAFAVLVAVGDVASAQSSVTLYGTVDLSAKYVKNDGSSRRLSLSQDGINSTQLGFRGIEDLGDGLKAGFVLLAGANPETGTTNTKFFNRRSTLSLFGDPGEIRLGRDYTPTFWNNNLFDAFGTNGLGDSSHVLQLLTPTFARADNSIQYFLPATLGGAYGQFMAAAGEGGGNGSTATNPGRYLGGRVGYAKGPLDVAGAYGQQTFVGTPGNLNSSGTTGSQRTWNAGGTYDFGAVKLLGYFAHDAVESAKENRLSLSGVGRLGQAEIHVGYERSKLTGSRRAVTLDNTVQQLATGVVYNLSKRTALYSTISRIKNGNQSSLAVATGSSITSLPTAGGKSTGAEAGIRHFF